MARKTKVYHTCDICGVDMDQPYNGGENGTYTLTATSDYAVTGHAMFWKELCEPCNSYLRRLISDLEVFSKDQKAARQAMETK